MTDIFPSAALPLKDGDLLAAVDLGSNSFHLQIGRVVDGQIYPLDAVREVVRLGGGLTAEKRIDRATQARALESLAKLAERGDNLDIAWLKDESETAAGELPDRDGRRRGFAPSERTGKDPPASRRRLRRQSRLVESQRVQRLRPRLLRGRDDVPPRHALSAGRIADQRHRAGAVLLGDLDPELGPDQEGH